MFKVIIDAGHGGTDIGVKGKSSQEKNLNLMEAKYLAKNLTKLGVEVIMTRDIDEYININSREIEEDADMLISFHKNGISHSYTKGCEVIYSTERKEDLKHALAMSSIISKVLNTKDLGGKIKLNSLSKDYNKIINLALEKNIGHIFLVNSGYLSNITEEIKLKDEELIKQYTAKMAEYIFFSILSNSTKIMLRFNNKDLDISNIVKGDKIFVDVNQLAEKIDIPIKCLKNNELIEA